jgi:dTDP-4-amino-4,6-dideoxygalactose transaminase
MKPVGGYFELELHKGGYSYHEVPYTFKSGRSALHFILKECKPTLVYIPFYTCHVILQSFESAGIAYKFYAIDENLEPVTLPDLANGEYFLYTHYFGLKNAMVNELSNRYGHQLIVDCTQAFFTKGNGRSWYFNSCRKFFGVPDGAYLYPPDDVSIKPVASSNQQYTVEHLVKRFNGQIQEGYASFKENEELCDAEITGMSAISQYLLSHINYKEVITARRANFNCLHHNFKNLNQFAIITDPESVPMVYPLITPYKTDREKLYSNGIFVPTFWAAIKEGSKKGFETESKLANNLLPLPIDHRYQEADMQKMATVIQLAK